MGKVTETLGSKEGRKGQYIAAVVVGAVILVWVLAETFSPGISEDLIGAADEVAGQVQAGVASIAAIWGAILALKNLSPDNGSAMPDHDVE